MIPLLQSCGTCRCFLPDERGESGMCRLNPPVYVGPPDDQEAYSDWAFWYQPMVRPDNACAQWRTSKPNVAGPAPGGGPPRPGQLPGFRTHPMA